MKQPDLEQLREVAARVAAEFECRLVVLHGSVARLAHASDEHGAERPAGRDDRPPADQQSPEDVDLAFLANARLDTVALSNRLISQLGIQEIDVVTLREADPVLAVLVAREGLPLYELNPGEFARFASLAIRRFADTRKFREAQLQQMEESLSRQISRS